jgi:uncharacterized protein
MIIVPSKYLVKIKLNNENYIIYHSLFGGARRVTKDVLNLIQRFAGGIDFRNALGKGELSVYKDTLLELKRQSFLVKEGSDEREVFNKYDLEEREKKLAEGKYIRSLTLEMVNYCNFHCRHCFEDKIYDWTKNEKMSFNTAKRAIDGFISILKKANNAWGTITFTGGEPLLNWEVMEQIIEYGNIVSKSASVKIFWEIFTNASLLNDSIIRIMEENNFMVVISLDGIGKENDRFRRFINGRGTFKNIIKGMDGLSRHCIDYKVELVLNDYNFDSVERVIDLAHDKYKCNSFTIGPIFFQKKLLKFDRHDNREKAKRLVEIYDYAVKKGVAVTVDVISRINKVFQKGGSLFYCNPLSSGLYVKPSGLVWPCPMTRTNIGTVQGIEKIPQGKSYRFVAMRGIDKLKSCRGCQIEGFCAGGCAGIAEFYSGNIYDTSHHQFRAFYCDFCKNIFIEMLKYLARK